MGIRGLKVAAFRELNKRTLPNLLPGENILRISADRIAAGWALELEVRYRADGKAVSVTRTTSRFPHYFNIDVPGVTSRVLDNYDHDFNNDALQMESIGLRLVPKGVREDPSLVEAEGEAKFQQSYPNPQLAELVVKKEVGTLDARPPRDRAGLELDPYETDVMQVSGFFPQSRAVWTDRKKYAKLVETFKTGKTVERWVAAEDLGNYPEAIDLLCEALPNADSDLTLHIVKALAQIKDKKASHAAPGEVEARTGSAPGTRYIPDALAAIGDRSVVPALVKPLTTCRFDYRSHIVYALGLLGGPTAENALRDLAKNDPFPAVPHRPRKRSGNFVASRDVRGERQDKDVSTSPTWSNRRGTAREEEGPTGDGIPAPRLTFMGAVRPYPYSTRP